MLFSYLSLFAETDAYFALLMTVTASQESLDTVNEMLKELEADIAASRYVLWLDYRMLSDVVPQTEDILELLRGKLQC